jgi:serine/threonine protein kinase
MSSPAAESTRTVGPYRLIGQIGEGGMGVVFLAQAPDDKRVAVKILRPSVIGDANGRARLAREVTSLRRVRSPRIAEIYDADPWGETPYVVMRYVPGPSLREVVDHRGPLTGQALTRLARGLAQALVVVHRADVLHRDVKPSNVLIQEGDPVLIDFGLAQLSDDMTLTQTGWLLGTPGYLAPEILYGDGPTPAADVHAWAATVTFAALGRGPYGSGPAMAVMDRARRGDSNLDGVPAGISDVLAAALRPDPANRPTARQLVEWLDARMDQPQDALVVAPADSSTTMTPVDRSPQEWSAPTPTVTAVVPTTASPSDRASETVSERVSDRVSEPVVVPETSTEPRSLRAIAFWVSILLVVMAATVAAPVVTYCWLAAAGWGLRTLHVGSLTWRAWRIKHGPRRRDEVFCALLIPWFGLRALGSSIVNALAVAAAAGGLVAVARFGPAVAETPVLVTAGLTAGLVAWLGPVSQDVRRGGRVVTANLPRSRLATGIILILLLGVVSGLLAVQQVVGTSYAPLSG